MAIVTVKLPRNPRHDPRNKRIGNCPIHTERRTCTDVTGSHHSYIERGATMDEIITKAQTKFGHVTRVEEIIEAYDL